jgi:hypothetical protein
MKTRLATFAFLLITASPAWGLTWQKAKYNFLGPLRADLMSFCDIGRRYNSAGISYWHYDKVKSNEANLRANGFGPSEIKAYLAGQAAAMAEVCPEVK